MKVLLLGASGQVGSLVLRELAAREVAVTAVFRTASTRFPDVPAGVAVRTVDDLAELPGGSWDVVVSCLGHNITAKGLFGPPWRLCADAARKVVETLQPRRFIMLSTAGVDAPGDPPRQWRDRPVLFLLSWLLPPHADNMAAADFLLGLTDEEEGQKKKTDWVAVRPDDFADGPVSDYTTHEHSINGLFDARLTRKANIAHFIADLVEDKNGLFQKWKHKFPVIVDKDDPGPPAAGSAS